MGEIGRLRRSAGGLLVLLTPFRIFPSTPFARGRHGKRFLFPRLPLHPPGRYLRPKMSLFGPLATSLERGLATQTKWCLDNKPSLSDP